MKIFNKIKFIFCFKRKNKLKQEYNLNNKENNDIVKNNKIVSVNRENKHKKDIEQKILGIISRSPIPINSIAIIKILNEDYDLNISQPRLRVKIANLRLTGNKIIANQKGYFLSNDEQVINNYINLRKKEIAKEKAVVGAMYV